MVECHLAKVKVAGPNPVSRSNGSNDSVSEKESMGIEQSVDWDSTSNSEVRCNRRPARVSTEGCRESDHTVSRSTRKRN